jgi:putative hydrolase of the HAD superfamily
MSISAFVFDMDDTLFPEVDFIFSGYKAVDKWLEGNFQITGFYGMATELYNLGFRKHVFNRSLTILKIKFDEKMIADMVNVYRFHDPVLELLEDAKWVFEHLPKSIKLGLISDGYLITQEKKINALRIKEKFHSIILSDSFGRQNWKPSPVPYINASIQLSCPHHECIYIGDNLSKDFITAKKLGWKTVHIRRRQGVYSNLQVSPEYEAHFQIQDLRELYSIKELKHLFDNWD